MSSSFMGENKYWITGKDIHKKIITSMIQTFLGPEATVRSYTNNGEDGFLISTPGECLTDDQIDEICKQSEQMWEQQAAERLPTAGSSSGLKRPLHKPVVISRARPRSASNSNSNGIGSQIRRPLGHRGSFHASSAAQPLPPPPPQQQQQQQRGPPRHPYQYDHYTSAHYAQQPYPPPPPPSASYDVPRDTGDGGRFSPYPQGHRRQQRSLSNSRNQNEYMYEYDDPWSSQPPPNGP